MSEYLVDRIRGTENIAVHEGAEIESVDGERRLESATLKSGEALQVSAVFVFIGAEPGGAWMPEEIMRDRLVPPDRRRRDAVGTVAVEGP